MVDTEIDANINISIGLAVKKISNNWLQVLQFLYNNNE